MGFSGPLIHLSSEFNLVDTLFLGLFAGFFFARVTHTVCVYEIAFCTGVWASLVHTYTYLASSSLSARQFSNFPLESTRARLLSADHIDQMQ